MPSYGVSYAADAGSEIDPQNALSVSSAMRRMANSA
jgi:hypothetical protein